MPPATVLFQTTKIQIFESNSQLIITKKNRNECCFRQQRYKFLKAIHNLVADSKKHCRSCFRQQRYKFLKAIHNRRAIIALLLYVVSDNKDTNFWKQFTTDIHLAKWRRRCFRQQRYKFLKAIHNLIMGTLYNQKLFQTTKIQIFESNSQLWNFRPEIPVRCFRQQRYKFLKAIHNVLFRAVLPVLVVSDNKDTNFWKQFTTQYRNRNIER